MSPYFTIGLPASHNDPLYALYSFALNRFILTEPNLEIAFKTAGLMFGKVDLRVVEISAADNFFPTIIDNTVVENWNMITENYYISLKTNVIKDLITPISLTENPIAAEDIQRVKTAKDWTEMCRFWVDIIESTKQHFLRENIPQEMLRSFIDEPVFPGPFHETEKSMLRHLYVDIDFDTTSEKIHNLAKNNPLINATLENRK